MLNSFLAFTSSQAASFTVNSASKGLEKAIILAPYSISRALVSKALSALSGSNQYSQQKEQSIDLQGLVDSFMRDIHMMGTAQFALENIDKYAKSFNLILPGISQGAIRSSLIGLIKRAQGDTQAAFDIEKILSDLIQGAISATVLSYSVQMVSDYIVDQDNDPLSQSWQALALGGMVGEGVMFGLKTLANRYAYDMSQPNHDQQKNPQKLKSC